ncbi:MAG: polysaccharide deacetylase family protein [Clostridia bacterium]
MRVKTLLLASMVLMLLSSTMLVVDDFGYAQVIGEAGALHAQPWTKTPVAAAPMDGMFLRMRAKAANWYYAELPNQQSGWIHQREVSEPLDIPSLFGTISNAEAVLFYPQPTESSTPIGLLPTDAVLQLQQSKGGWSQVAFGQASGYIRDEALELRAVENLPQADAAAQELLPYVPPRKIDPAKPMIALTFDDGPSQITLDVLRVLEKYEVPGTFFVVGNRVRNHAAILRKVAAQGHEIGLHTWNHRELHKLSRNAISESLQKNIDAVQAATGVVPKLLRPPYGTATHAVRGVCAELDLVIANWNVDTEDWRNQNTQMIANSILKNAADGSIVLMHDLYQQTTEALKMVVPTLIERGYQLVTVSEMLNHRAQGGKAGAIYRGLPLSQLPSP